MENEFDDVMRKRSDAELISIVEGPPCDYQPLALESAKKEFKRRNLSESQIKTAKHVIVEKSQVEQAKASESLPKIWKVLAIIFPGLILIAFAFTFKADGYQRKSTELVKWTIYGGLFYFGIISLLLILGSLFRVH